MTHGWKPWEVEATEESTLVQLSAYLVRTGAFAGSAPKARTPRDGEDAVDIFAGAEAGEGALRW